MSASIARKDFDPKTIALLEKKGVQVVGVQAMPLFEGDKYFGGQCYMLSFNGQGFMRTHSQILIMARSSWCPKACTL